MQNSLKCIINYSKTVAEQPVNVSAAVSDVKIQNSSGGVTLDFYSADILSAQDYFPFGMLMPGRSFSSNSLGFGFNGMLMNNEITGITGANYNTEYREYDTRLCIWKTIDQMSHKHPDYTPYAFCYNNPIMYIDPWGLDTILFNSNGSFGKPIPSNDEKDTYIKVNRKEFENNQINYDRKGELRNRYKNMQIDKSFFENMGKEGDTYIYNAGNYKVLKNIFEFFAGNTKVEWGHLIYQNLLTGDTKCEICTQNTEKIVYFYFPNNLKKENYKLVDLRHSHLSGFISSDDRDLYEEINKKRPVRAYIFKDGHYFEFNNEQSRKERFSVEPQSY